MFRGADQLSVGLVLGLLCSLTLPPPTFAFDRQNDNAAAVDVVVNPEGRSYDSHPCAATADNGTTWIAWHGYHQSRDSVFLRRIESDGRLGPVHTVSDDGETCSPPSIVLLESDSVWVVWSAEKAGRWRVFARNFLGGQWRPTIELSQRAADAIHPAAARVTAKKLVVAWSGFQNGRFRIYCRVLQGQTWRDPQVLSSDANDAFRPALAVDAAGIVWTFWDRYHAPRYNVLGRQTLPELGPVESISPSDRHCLSPTALATRQGLCVAWLQKEDVIGGPGVVSQRHTLHVALRDQSDWHLIADKHGDTVAAELTQGLVAKIQPEAVATGGYLGRRTAPMLMEEGDRVWLLWERKADHRGRTPNAVGELVGRPMQMRSWQEKVVLHSGQLDYHLSHSRRADNGRFVVLASQLPRYQRRLYHRLVVDIAQADTFTQDAWPGWRPVELPIRDELTELRELRIGKKTYRLYWADMHCHSGLTSDAEGEHDELMHYARDRARLDAVVFTNNDYIYDVPLTAYEYALGNFFAKVYSRPHRFLSLPGYEWTSRVPGVPGAGVSDPGNWTTPYKNRSFPNHRSVVYPPSGGPVIRYPEVSNDINVLNEAVARAGGLTFTQHDAFQPSGHAVEIGMELTSGWRNYIARVPKLFHEPLDRGARLAFVANGDTHRRAPGLSGALTGIFAEELTADSIFNALRDRRCYATNGSRIFVDARANGAMMGEEVAARDGEATLTLRVIGTRPIVSVVLVRDGREIGKFAGTGSREFTATYRDKGLSPKVHWYYWRISQERAAPVLPGNLMAAHGHLAWSTPHWVVVTAEDR